MFYACQVIAHVGDSVVMKRKYFIKFSEQSAPFTLQWSASVHTHTRTHTLHIGHMRRLRASKFTYFTLAKFTFQ